MCSAEGDPRKPLSIPRRDALQAEMLAESETLRTQRHYTVREETVAVSQEVKFVPFAFPPFLLVLTVTNPSAENNKNANSLPAGAQPLTLIYELPTSNARCSSDHVLRRWSRVRGFNSPLQAARDPRCQ